MANNLSDIAHHARMYVTCQYLALMWDFGRDRPTLSGAIARLT